MPLARVALACNGSELECKKCVASCFGKPSSIMTLKKRLLVIQFTKTYLLLK
jgi:hypothetical protein